MKRCPECHRDHDDDSLQHCLAARVVPELRLRKTPRRTKRQMKTVLLFAILTLVSFLPVPAQSVADALDRYIEASRQDWKVPGMSVVVVHDGKVILSKGYGVREIGRSDPVDSETLFGAMSTT